MASTFSNKRDEIVEDLEHEVDRLKRELSSVRRSAMKQGASFYDDLADVASSVYDQFMRQGSGTGRKLARQARYARSTATDHPVVTAVVGIAVIGLVASLLMRRD